MRDVFNNNGVTKEKLYHQYNFQLFDIKDMEYEKLHGGYGRNHADNCECCRDNKKALKTI